MATAPRKKAGDLTGRRLEEQAEEARQAEKDRSKELAMASAQQKVLDETGVFDPQTGDVIDVEDLGDDVEDLTALTLDDDDSFTDLGVEEVSEQQVIVRIAEDFTACLGVPGDPGSWRTFERGKKYRMARSDAEYLDTKGVIWH